MEKYIEGNKAAWEEAFDNLPESLEGSDRYEMMEEAVGNLDDALSLVEDTIECLESAREC